MSLFRTLNNVFTPARGRHASTASATSCGPASSGDNSLSTFTNGWTIIKNVMTSPTLRHEPLEKTPVQAKLDLMLDCLAVEGNMLGSGSGAAGNGGPTGDCLEFFLKSDIPSQLVSLSLPDQPLGSKGLVIAFFSSLIVLMDEHFVVHSKVHKPLLRLLRSCVEPETDLDGDDEGATNGWRTKDGAYEEAVVEMMCHVCSRIKTFPELLAVFLHERPKTSLPGWPSSPTGSQSTSAVITPTPRKTVHFSDPRSSSPTPSANSTMAVDSTRELAGTMAPPSSQIPSGSASASGSVSTGQGSRSNDSDMLIFSYLLRFVHREGKTGDLARAGLLFLMELAMGRRFSNLVSDNPFSAGKGGPTKSQTDAALSLGEWVLDSDFSDVLGAGLGAAYGLLPSKLVIKPPAPELGSATEGMMLGGVGLQSEEGVDEDTQRVDAESRMQSLGLAESDSPDFQTQFGLFVGLLEFTQDILRRAPPSVSLAFSPQPPTTSDSASTNEAGQRPAELVASAITSAVLASLRKLFLSAILYPSLLECSETDGSAVAVMSYLEAMLNLFESDGRLADTILRFLMTDEDEEGLPRRVRQRKSTILFSAFDSPSSTSETKKAKLRRRRSGALQLIQAEVEKADPRRTPAASYFSSLGRFTLKDLLIGNIKSSNQATATAALKLLHTILTRHDRYALALLEVIPDPHATAFPFPTSGEDLPALGGASSDRGYDSDDEGFLYPAPASATPTKPIARTPIKPYTPFQRPPDVEFASRILASPAATYEAHQDDIDSFASLIHVIDPARSEEGNASSTAFVQYLRDAELELASNLGFRRGLTLDAVCTTPLADRSGAGLTNDTLLMELIDEPLVRHALPATSPLVASLLDSLAHFFSHTPEVNLGLTGCIAALAACPTRSLVGWLLPSQAGAEGPLDTFISKQRTLRNSNDDGDDRSIDFAIDELSRYVGREYTPGRCHDLSVDEAAVLSIYQELASQVACYRKSVKHFDKFLSERRQGLLFVENLADALDAGDMATDYFQVPAAGCISSGSAEEPSFAAELRAELLPKLDRAKDSLAAFFTPSKGSAAAPPVTPPLSTPSVGAPDSPGTTQSALSPFSKHYKQTRAISITPLVATTPASKKVKKYADRAGFGAAPVFPSREDQEIGFGLETPTKKTFGSNTLGGVSFPTLSPQAHDDSDFDSDSDDKVHEDEQLNVQEAAVSLSVLLDNVVVLEEAVKELAAIVSARRELGIDSVRFI